jgi:ABC-type multidrug transport system permease subunit
MARNLKHIWYIAFNDVRLFVTDRLAMGMFILFPFLFIVMFNIMLGDVGAQDSRLELHVVTGETSGISVDLVQSMATTDVSKLAPGEPVIIWDRDYSQAIKDVEAKKLDGFLAFPADFTANVQAGKQAGLEIVALADATSTRMALEGIAGGIASAIAADSDEIKTVAALLTQQGSSSEEIQAAIVQILGKQTSGGQALVTYKADKIGEVKSMSASSYTIPGYLVMFVFFAAAMASTSIIRDRRNFTMERMIALSVKRESFLGGFFLGGIFRGLVQIIIFWTVGFLVFHVDVGGAPWAVVILSLLTVIMSAAFSLMLATVAKTDRSASALAVLCSLILAPLGGCWWPLFITPGWMQFLAKFTPHGWANEGFNKLMLFGATGGDVVWDMLALVGFAVVFAVIAVFRFRTDAA